MIPGRSGTCAAQAAAANASTAVRRRMVLLMGSLTSLCSGTVVTGTREAPGAGCPEGRAATAGPVVARQDQASLPSLSA